MSKASMLTKCPNCPEQADVIEFNTNTRENETECSHCGYAYSKVMTNYEEAIKKKLPASECNFLIKEYFPELETGKAVEHITEVKYIDKK